MLLSNSDFKEKLERATVIWSIGRLPFKAMVDGEPAYPQRLFVTGSPVEIGDFVTSEFGKLAPLSSIGAKLYRESVSFPQTGRRYGAFLRSGQIPMASRLLLGGREFVVPGSYQGMQHIDRNSAYPAICQNLALPTPYFLRYAQNVSTRAAEKFIRTQSGFGFFQAILTEDVPHQGVLPVARGTYQYPRAAGEIVEGIWTFNEMRYAFEWGYRVRKAHWLWHCPVDFPYLSPIQGALYEKRISYRSTIGEAIYKAIANKLIGRIAMVGSPISIWKRGEGTKVVNPPILSNRLHTAYIVAEQRCAMHAAITSAINPVYAFTDSLVCESLPDVKVGTGLGEWKLFPSSGEYVVRGRGQYVSENRSANRGGKEWQ